MCYPAHMFDTKFVRAFQTRYEMHPGGCWEWYGPFDKDGYGKIKRHGKTLRAHRVSYEIANGPIPDGLLLMHSCDNPKCVNPKHLTPGTVAANNQDMTRKGRNAQGTGEGLRGADNAQSRLTAIQVVRIRCRAAQGVSQAALAREYGVSQATIHKIIRRELWHHI